LEEAVTAYYCRGEGSCGEEIYLVRELTREGCRCDQSDIGRGKLESEVAEDLIVDEREGQWYPMKVQGEREVGEEEKEVGSVPVQTPWEEQMREAEDNMSAAELLFE
jgi:hypothetical protein